MGGGGGWEGEEKQQQEEGWEEEEKKEEEEEEEGEREGGSRTHVLYLNDTCYPTCYCLYLSFEHEDAMVENSPGDELVT